MTISIKSPYDGGGGGTFPQTHTIASTTAVGDFIVVTVWGNGSIPSSFSVSDSLNGSYTALTPFTTASNANLPNYRWQAFGVRVTTAGSPVITVNSSPAIYGFYQDIVLTGFTGTPTVGDSFAQGNGLSTTAVSVPAYTATRAEMLLGSLYSDLGYANGTSSWPDPVGWPAPNLLATGAGTLTAFTNTLSAASNWTFNVVSIYDQTASGAALASTPQSVASAIAALTATPGFIGIPLLTNISPPNTGLGTPANVAASGTINPLVNAVNNGRIVTSAEVSYALTGTVDSPVIAGDVPGTTNSYLITPNANGYVLQGLTTIGSTAMQNGFIRAITNASPTYSFSLGHNVSGANSSRFLCPSGTNLTVPPYSTVLVRFSAGLVGSTVINP